LQTVVANCGIDMAYRYGGAPYWPLRAWCDQKNYGVFFGRGSFPLILRSTEASLSPLPKDDLSDSGLAIAKATESPEEPL